VYCTAEFESQFYPCLGKVSIEAKQNDQILTHPSTITDIFDKIIQTDSQNWAFVRNECLAIQPLELTQNLMIELELFTENSNIQHIQVTTGFDPMSRRPATQFTTSCKNKRTRVVVVRAVIVILSS